MSDSVATDGAAAVLKLAAMVHLLEGSESPKYQRLIRRAEALQATSHHAGNASRNMYLNRNGSIDINHKNGILATEGASSMATLAGAHAARGDYLEASRLQQRAIDFETAQCRRSIREWKRAMDRTDRANEVSKFPEEPLLVKRDDLTGGKTNAELYGNTNTSIMFSNNNNDNSDGVLTPPHLREQMAVIADLFETLGDYQEAANNQLECSASRRKARTLRSAITF
jgi:hypothetical protein